jgi:hypothetical protein
VINSAGELKYMNQIRKVIAAQLAEPDDDFIRFFASRVYDGVITQKVRELFADLTVKAFKQYLNDKVNERLKSALQRDSESTASTKEAENKDDEDDSEESKVVTTEEEVAGFNIVRAIMCQNVDIERVTPRDTQSYFGVLLDDNNRKPICRLHFNRSQKYIGIFDKDKKETRHAIDRVEDIFQFADQLKETCSFYE